MAKAKGPGRTDQQLSSLLDRRAASWVEIGQFLDQVEKGGNWNQHSSSFSAWLRTEASHVRVSQSSLWRFLSCVRLYEDLRIEFPKACKALPSIDKIADSISPEHIELLGKLRRVAPTEVMEKLLFGVLSGNTTRASLRRTWRAYRPAMQGLTARGRGRSASAVLDNDVEYLSEQDRAFVIEQLRDSTGSWVGTDTATSGRTFTDVTVGDSSADSPAARFDLVLAVPDKDERPPVFHGVVIADFDEHVSRMALSSPVSYCDYFWIATRNRRDDTLEELLVPAPIGLLAAGKRGVTVIQHAMLLKERGRKPTTANASIGSLHG